MASFADSLKHEIARVARKEMKAEIASLRKATTAHRTEIAALKRVLKQAQVQIHKLEKGAAKVSKAIAPDAPPAAPGSRPGRKISFTAARMLNDRKRLGFTQAQIAKLLGVSSLTAWKWETGKAEPRKARVPEVVRRLKLGKREALRLIEE